MASSAQDRFLLVPRRVAPRVEAALADTRVVLITGPRQAGKTTLARQFAGPDRPYVTLDDITTLRAARSDPVGFIRGLDRAVIDEVQRAPDLLLAIKDGVDRDPTPGRYLLTGSADVLALPIVGDSLAGRVEVVPLLPFAQAELRRTPGLLIEHLLAGDPISIGSPVVGEELVDLVLRGGYPEAQRRPDPARRQAWFDDYTGLILDRDVRDIARIDQFDRLPRLLSILAEQAGQLVNHAGFGAALGLSGVTAQKYIAILERLFLVRTMPPWSTNRLTRLVKSAKIHFLDSGLLGALRGAGAEEIRRDRTRFGPLLETFVVSEVMKLTAASPRRLRLSHFRTKAQDEVDLVVEDPSGRLIGIEVKASATVRPQDFRGLRQLQSAVGDRFVHGLVLHDHDRIVPFGEKLHSAPISCLWTT